jgi:hypothetical protein
MQNVLDDPLPGREVRGGCLEVEGFQDVVVEPLLPVVERDLVDRIDIECLDYPAWVDLVEGWYSFFISATNSSRLSG